MSWTSPHLFRYTRSAARRPRRHPRPRRILALDTAALTLLVEAGTTYADVVEYTLRRGFLPTVTPELKGITVGGAIVGVGIESSGFKYGFVHDGLVSADVRLANGDLVHVSDTNGYADLMAALPNSYGTLGALERCEIQLIPARPFVHLGTRRYVGVDAFLDAMRDAADEMSWDFVEGLIYSARELYLICGRLVDEAPHVADIYGRVPYHKQLRNQGELWLTTEDYIFRYDPDWFWNVPDQGIHAWFRRLAPRRMKHSGFYQRYVDFIRPFREIWGRDDGGTEPLIQDWEVPWAKAVELTEAALHEVDLLDKPWAAVPIRPHRSPTLFPLRSGDLYFNLGSYCWTASPIGDGRPFHYTRLMDRYCFDLGGLKLLYSSTFIDEPSFDVLYNGTAYRRLKDKYDPGTVLPMLYAKVANI